MYPVDFYFPDNIGCLSHGSLKLTVSSPVQSFTEPLTVSELRDFLSLTADDDTDVDAMLSSFISAAREIFEIEQGRDLIRKQYDFTLDNLCCSVYELKDDLVSVDLFRYRDSDGNYTTLVENTDYIVATERQPGAVAPAPNTTWPSFTPWPLGAVLIRFTAGLAPTDPFWSNEGERIKTGMKILCKSWFSDEPAEKGNASGIPWAAQVLAKYGSIPRTR